MQWIINDRGQKKWLLQRSRYMLLYSIATGFLIATFSIPLPVSAITPSSIQEGLKSVLESDDNKTQESQNNPQNTTKNDEQTAPIQQITPIQESPAERALSLTAPLPSPPQPVKQIAPNEPVPQSPPNTLASNIRRERPDSMAPLSVGSTAPPSMNGTTSMSRSTPAGNIREMAPETAYAPGLNTRDGSPVTYHSSVLTEDQTRMGYQLAGAFVLSGILLYGAGYLLNRKKQTGEHRHVSRYRFTTQ
jgi:hypothetical protein